MYLNIKTCLVWWEFTPEFKQNNISLNFEPINKNSPTKNLYIIFLFKDYYKCLIRRITRSELCVSVREVGLVEIGKCKEKVKKIYIYLVI